MNRAGDGSSQPSKWKRIIWDLKEDEVRASLSVDTFVVIGKL